MVLQPMIPALALTVELISIATQLRLELRTGAGRGGGDRRREPPRAWRRELAIAAARTPHMPLGDLKKRTEADRPTWRRQTGRAPQAGGNRWHERRFGAPARWPIDTLAKACLRLTDGPRADSGRRPTRSGRQPSGPASRWPHLANRRSRRVGTTRMGAHSGGVPHAPRARHGHTLAARPNEILRGKKKAEPGCGWLVRGTPRIRPIDHYECVVGGPSRDVVPPSLSGDPAWREHMTGKAQLVAFGGP